MSQSPAILLITADELLREALSCHGNRAVQTPNIDRIASEGTRYDRAHTVSPWCLPARWSILTGLLPHNSGAYSNFRPVPEIESLPNLYTALGARGYRTAHVGKCHYLPVPYSETRRDATLPYESFRDAYLRLGMDHLDLQDDKQVSVWFYDDYARELDREGLLEPYRRLTWQGKENGRVFDFPGPAEWHPDSWVGRKSVDYIESHSPDTPMFLWASFSGPHYPMDAPREYLDRVDMSKDTPRRYAPGEFDDRSRLHASSYHGPGGIDGCGGAPDNACGQYTEEYWTRMRRQYYANVAQIDEWVGRILDAAESRFGDNVAVIFTADHGEMLGNHGIWGKNNCAYEEVWGIPLLVRLPSGVSRESAPTAGVSEEAIVTNMDVAATCLAIAGGAETFGDGQHLESLAREGGREHVLAEGEGFIAVTDGSAKLVRVQQPPDRRSPDGRYVDELYDRAVDPGEVRNLIDDPGYASRVAELRGVALNAMAKSLLS